MSNLNVKLYVGVDECDLFRWRETLQPHTAKPQPRMTLGKYHCHGYEFWNEIQNTDTTEYNFTTKHNIIATLIQKLK